MTPQDLIKLANGLTQMEANDRVYSTIEQLGRLKSTIPFSARLNEFIQEWYDKIKNMSLIDFITYLAILDMFFLILLIVYLIIESKKST